MASTQLVVTAPLVIAKTDEGRDLYLYEGAAVPSGQSQEWLKRHRDAEMIGDAEVATRQLPTGDGSSSSSSSTDDDPHLAFISRNADDVIADVGTLTEEDRVAVLEAERANKNRTTVVAALEGAGSGS